MLKISTAWNPEEFDTNGDILRGLASSLDISIRPWCQPGLVSRLLGFSNVMRVIGLLILIFIFGGFQPMTAHADERPLLRRWVRGQSTCFACPIRIVTPKGHPQMETPEAQAFFRTLEEEKPTLMALYGIDGQEYNSLALMAIGILGQESQFFQSEWYHVKEAWPYGVRIAKYLRIYYERVVEKKNRPMTVNSRGPTQIKHIPEAIRDHYKITETQLGVPRNAAVATMGFLIRALRQLRTRIANGQLPFVNESNYPDYLPYLYFGSRKMLLDGKAEPERNIYVRNMRAFMDVTLIYELDSEQQVLGDVVMRQSSTGRVAQ